MSLSPFRLWKKLRQASDPTASQFLSLRWRIFPALMLLMMTLSITQGYFSFRQEEESSQLKHLAESQSHRNNLAQLIEQHKNRLAQIGPYLELLRQSTQAKQDAQVGLLKVMDEKWLDTQLAFGFDGIAVFDAQQHLLFNRGVIVNEQMSNWLGLTSALGQPLHTIACARRCALAVTIPMLLAQGSKEMSLVAVVDLSVIVKDLAAIHNIDLVLLGANPSRDSARRRLWSLPILGNSIDWKNQTFYQQLESSVSLEQIIEGVEIPIADDHFRVHTIPIDAIDGDIRAHLLVIDNVSAQALITQRYLQRNILLMLLLIAAAISLSWLSLRPPLQRISALATNLPLLARQQYRNFRQSCERGTASVFDEVDRLQQTSVELSYQLEEMQSELQRRANEMQQMALSDPLTKLANRSLFLANLRREILAIERNGSGIAVLFLDLDRFKNLNDTLGHQAGDQLLIAVGQRLTQALRKTDCVARNGGDEFTILLTNINTKSQLQLIIEQVFQCFETPFDLGKSSWHVQTSIGATLVSDSNACADAALKQADLAMYAAKQAGRGTFRTHTSDMQEELDSTVNLEQELCEALEKQEFELHFQPIFNIQGTKIVSGEALLRWQHPTNGLLSAGSFIGVLERSHLMRDVGYWVLESCIQFAKRLQEEGHGHITLALNLASVQLLDDKLYDFIERKLRQYDLEPQALEIEVTESQWMENLTAASQQINRLRALGTSVSLDDFGTGYSSLSYLRSLPMDVIKIDRSFIADLETNATDRQKVHSVASLCHNLGKRVIAEGVETETQLRLLQSMQVDYLQGYLLARPMPAQQLLDELNQVKQSAQIADAIH